MKTTWLAFAFLALLAAGLLIRAQLVLRLPSGDATGHYTDHLRHMGEALILADQGFVLYRKPYGELIAQEPVMCAEHLGLFPERTAPYPPAPVLVHWPVAKLEAAGWLSPVGAHRAAVWIWMWVALAAAAAVVRLFAKQPSVAQLWAGVIALPLLVGMGANGIIDSAYLLFGALGCLAWRQQRPVVALWALALAAAFHFRAAVFAPLAVAIVWELGWSRRLRDGLLSAVVVFPSAAAAFLLSGTLETIPADNPVHFSHFNRYLLMISLLGAATALWLWWKSERWVALTVLAAVALAVLERSHAWWHAGPLLAPAFVLAARPPVKGWTWAVLLVWTVASSFLAYRYSASAFWQWLPFALFGVR